MLSVASLMELYLHVKFGGGGGAVDTVTTVFATSIGDDRFMTNIFGIQI